MNRYRCIAQPVSWRRRASQIRVAPTAAQESAEISRGWKLSLCSEIAALAISDSPGGTQKKTNTKTSSRDLGRER